jgi:hypothetical protein
MNYIIRKFDESFGQLIIQYDDVTFAYDIPIDENNNYLIGDALDEQIKLFLPVWHTERKEKIAAGVGNAEAIRALVEPYPENPPSAEELIVQEATQSSSVLKDFIIEVVNETLNNRAEPNT